MKVSLSKVKMYDIDGKVAKTTKEGALHKLIANIIYTKCRNLDLVDIAMQMNKGLTVEMAPAHVAELKSLINDPENGVFSFAQKAILDYIDDIETQERNKNKKDGKSKRKRNRKK